MPLGKASRAQAAIDFVTSYGIAFVVIVIAVAVIYQTSIAAPSLTVSSCTAAPGFSCDFFALSGNTGILTVTLSQATGGQITIHGAACSSQLSGNGGGPLFGNYNVIGYNAVTNYYPSGNWINGAAAPNGIVLYSDSGATMTLDCFSSAGGVAKGPVGNSFIGYLWLNYTPLGLTTNTVQRVASLNLVYS